MAAISGWVERAGRFVRSATGRSTFGAIFSKMAQYDFPGWAVLEWECALKHPHRRRARRRESSFAGTLSAVAGEKHSTTSRAAAWIARN